MVKEQEQDEDFSEDRVPSSNWMKFSKVGDSIIGTLVEKYEKPGVGDFKPQTVYVLANCKAIIDGKKDPQEDFNVGISSNYVNTRFKSVEPGTRIGLKFDREIAAKVKGYKNAKSLMPNIFGRDPKFEQIKKDIDFDE